jgi:hypothetical protein
MYVVMIETTRGSEDGFTIRYFKQGKSYDVADMLARALISAGQAMEFRLSQKF